MRKYILFITLFLSTEFSWSQDSLIISNVLQQIELDSQQCKVDFISYKKIPHYPSETIVVIPEIVKDEGAYFELNSHIFIVDSESGKIKNSFFESHKTNEWYSDAIALINISIDTAPYYIQNKKRAFGINVKYVGMSRVNPYVSKTTSLFIKQNSELKRILNRFEIYKYYGEWNGQCHGDINEEKKILIMDKNKTNGFYNILIKNKKTNTKTYLNNKEECIDKENSKTISSTLIFEEGEYKEVHYLD